MRRPANAMGVVMCLLLAAVLLGFSVALGSGETTRRGIPVWLAAAVGTACFLYGAVKAWKEPAKVFGAGDGDRALSRGTKFTFALLALFFIAPLVMLRGE